MIKRYLPFFICALLLHLLFYFLFNFKPYKNITLKDNSTKNDYVTFKMVDLPKETKKASLPISKKKPTFTKKTAVSSSLPTTSTNINQKPDQSSDTILLKNETLAFSSKTQKEEVYLKTNEVSTLPKLPLPALKRALKYPKEAKKKGIEGAVYLQVYMNTEGIIEKVEILKEKPNSSFGFGLVAKEALLGLKGTPAKLNGKNVNVVFRYPVKFELE